MILRNAAHPGGIDVGPARGRLSRTSISVGGAEPPMHEHVSRGVCPLCGTKMYKQKPCLPDPTRTARAPWGHRLRYSRAG